MIRSSDSISIYQLETRWWRLLRSAMTDPFDEIEALALGLPLPKKVPPRKLLPAKVLPPVTPAQEVKQVKESSKEVESTEAVEYTEVAEPSDEITPLMKLFQERKIRIRGTLEKLLICGADVGCHIGDKNYDRQIKKYAPGKYVEIVMSVGTNGRRCQMLYLTEAGLYKYLLQSKREEAEEFQDFVFDILTAERKKTVDSIQLALKISQTENDELRREKASLQREKSSAERKQMELYKAVNSARETSARLQKTNNSLVKQKHAAADAEEMRLCGRQVEQIRGWNC